MIIRFGFVAMSLKLEKASPSRTMTYKRYTQLKDDQARMYHLRKIVAENLKNTLRVITHAQAHNIMVYRFTSRLIPLVTHTEVKDWDYVNEFKESFDLIGNFIKKYKMRVSAHPDHFTLLTSPNEEVFNASFRDFNYHNSLFEAMSLGHEAKLIIHVGGKYNSKTKAIDRFYKNFDRLPSSIQKRVALENDDKVYTADDVLSICKDLKLPMVLDIHHYNCNKGDLSLKKAMEEAFETWEKEYWHPKIHISSPKSEKHFRNHAEDIDVEDFVRFLKLAKSVDKDFDVMIEAKNKDIALFNLVSSLQDYNDIDIINSGIIEI